MSLPRSQIQDAIKRISNVTGQDALINTCIQIALDRVYQAHDWPYYIQDKGVIRTVDDYSTGTVEATQNSVDVTFTNSTLTSGMAGRKIRIGNDNAYYRIRSVDTTASTAVLEQPYQGTTDTDATFVIYKDEYRLAPDIDIYKTFRQAENAISLFSLHPTRFDETFPMPQSYGDPSYEIMEGTLQDSYSTGTVTASGTTITGSATCLWTSVEGLDKGSKIRISSDIYTVKSVDSDTQITTYETMTTVGTASAYEIYLPNIRVQLYQIPDSARLLYYRYFRLPAPLANNYDLPDMPYEFHYLLIWGALSEIWAQKGDPTKSVQFEDKFKEGLTLMKLKLGSFTPDRIYLRRSLDRFRRKKGFEDGLEPSSFDRRYSSPW